MYLLEQYYFIRRKRRLPKVRRTCSKCGKLFWTTPYKDKEGNWHTDNICQKCKNRIRQKKQRGITIRDMGKVDISREIQKLIWLENRHPELIEKIRSKEYGKKKKRSSKSFRSKKKVKG